MKKSQKIKLGISWCCEKHCWFAFVLLVFFTAFSIFRIMSFSDCTRLHHQETTIKMKCVCNSEKAYQV